MWISYVPEQTNSTDHLKSTKRRHKTHPFNALVADIESQQVIWRNKQQYTTTPRIPAS